MLISIFYAKIFNIIIRLTFLPQSGILYHVLSLIITERGVSEMEKQLRVAAIHDLSGFGRCALTVVIPVISAMGIQCAAIPTAVLSTHTGGFSDFVLCDMTDFLSPCCKHYKDLGIEFDAIYSGFLASEEQVDCCIEFFKAFPHTLKIIDPVMGDDGAAYQTYTDGLIRRTKELVTYADIITPNLTEAALLLDEKYPEALSETEARSWAERLCEKSKAAVITGVSLTDGSFANVSCDRRSGCFNIHRWERIPVSYPGTGDIFASVFTGAVLKGMSLSEAVIYASVFCEKAINATIKSGEPVRNGVEFERVLSFLWDKDGSDE